MSVFDSNDADVLLDSIVRSELNLERWPGIWQASNMRSDFNSIRKIEKKIMIGGRTVLASVTVESSPSRGTLNTEDQKTFYALLALWEKKGRPDEVSFTIRGILKEMGRQYGKNTREGIIDSLKRLKSVDITWENSFFDKVSNKTMKELAMFNVLSYLKISSEESHGHEKDRIQITFHKLIDSNLRNYHSIPTRYWILMKIKNPLSQLLYKYLEPKLYSALKFERKTYDLLNDLGIFAMRYKKLSNRVDVITRALKELTGLKIQDGILEVHLELSKEDDYKLVAIKNLDPNESHQSTAFPLLTIDIETEKNVSESPEVIIEPVNSALNLQFFEIFKEQFKISRNKATKSELEKAKVWVNVYGFDLNRIRDFVEFAFQEASKTKFRVQNLSGLGQYLEPFINGVEPQSTGLDSPIDQILEESIPESTTDETGKEKALEILKKLSPVEQAYWCQSASTYLRQDNPASLKRILQFDPETQKETLLALAARQFTKPILLISESLGFYQKK